METLLQNRGIIEQFLRQKPKGGTSSIWYDNKTQIGTLYKHQTKMQTFYPMIDIEKFMQETTWDYKSMQHHLLIHIFYHVKLYLNLLRHTDEGKGPQWLRTSNGQFFVKDVWEVLRRIKKVNDSFQKIQVYRGTRNQTVHAKMVVG